MARRRDPNAAGDGKPLGANGHDGGRWRRPAASAAQGHTGRWRRRRRRCMQSWLRQRRRWWQRRQRLWRWRCRCRGWPGRPCRRHRDHALRRMRARALPPRRGRQQVVVASRDCQGGGGGHDLDSWEFEEVVGGHRDGRLGPASPPLRSRQRTQPRRLREILTLRLLAAGSLHRSSLSARWRDVFRLRRARGRIEGGGRQGSARGLVCPFVRERSARGVCTHPSVVGEWPTRWPFWPEVAEREHAFGRH